MKNKSKPRKKATKKTSRSYPGYPKYPAQEDIMNRGERILLDENSPRIEGTKSLEIENGVSPENSANPLNTVSNPDLLDPENNIKSESEKRIYPIDFSGKDLDVPGSELDDETEKTGNEDEENNLYSLGNPDQ